MSDFDQLSKDQEVKFLNYVSGMGINLSMSVYLMWYQRFKAKGLKFCFYCCVVELWYVLASRLTPGLVFSCSFSAAEELIQHLKSENDRLRLQVNELSDEVASTRYGLKNTNSICLVIIIFCVLLFLKFV